MKWERMKREGWEKPLLGTTSKHIPECDFSFRHLPQRGPYSLIFSAALLLLSSSFQPEQPTNGGVREKRGEEKEEEEKERKRERERISSRLSRTCPIPREREREGERDRERLRSEERNYHDATRSPKRKQQIIKFWIVRYILLSNSLSLPSLYLCVSEESLFLPFPRFFFFSLSIETSYQQSAENQTAKTGEWANLKGERERRKTQRRKEKEVYIYFHELVSFRIFDVKARCAFGQFVKQFGTSLSKIMYQENNTNMCSYRCHFQLILLWKGVGRKKDIICFRTWEKEWE